MPVCSEFVHRTVATAVALLGAFAVVGNPTPAFALWGGPDAGGYTWRDATDGGPVFNYEVGGGASNVGIADDGFQIVPLPFAFTFYGDSYTSVDIHANGGISFGSLDPLPHDHACPMEAFGAPMVAAYHCDLTPGSVATGIFVWTAGSAPNRYFVIEWYRVPLFGVGGSVTFELKLFEADNHIEAHYEDTAVDGSDKDSGQVAAVGCSPGATVLEVSCNQALIPDGYALGFYPPPPCEDADADGFSATSCGGTDCNDDAPAVNPDAEEICDGLDTNCDQALPLVERDQDGDGWAPCEGDCDDLAPGLYPYDTDGDGVTPCDGDCDDDENTIFPGAPELCDGVDNQCDGVTPAEDRDADGDGQRPCQGDCDDSKAFVYVGAEETCDGVDNDCDKDIDEGLDCGPGANATNGEDIAYGCIVDCSAASSTAPSAGPLALLLAIGGLAVRRRRRGAPPA